MEEKKLCDEELQLAEQMKQSYCKELVYHGILLKETDPENAAEILHKIASIYKLRSPDKVSLIKCVGLLNAAILRNPSNISQMKADLNDVCKHVLEHAKANNRNADLVAKANTVKDEFQKLRKHVDNYLKQINAQIKTEELGKLQVRKAESIRFINKTIANKYKQIMADISKFCSDIMGKPPCEYSIVGMGSLARNEITPYSDFEHIILLRDDENYEQHLEYFRWHSVIFHIIVLTLQESIIPSLNIKSLSWFFDAHTPQGISVDGMMPHACKFPLGRFEKTKNKPFVTELIKPVSEMLKYLSSEEDLKNGYHLADILTKTCFVFGNENIFDQFANGVKTYLSSKSKRERINDMKKQVRDDLIKFFVRFRLANLKSQDTINIKQLVYRSSTLFVSALGSIHNISECSCFDIIQAMANKNIISQTTKVKLSYAVAIACEMRLRVYTERKSQCDNPIELNETDENIKKFLSIVGVKNTINYFQIAYCLQREVAKQLDFTKLHFYSDPRLINITIGIAFGIELLHSISEIPLKCDWRVRNFNFDDCIETLETKFHFNYDIMKNDFQLNKELIVTLAEHLFEVNIFDESLEFYQQFLAVLHKDTTEKNTNRTTARIYQKIGHCLIRLQKWSDSVKFFYKAIEIFQLTCLDQETDEELAIAFNQLGFALKEVYQYTEASIYLKRSLEIQQKKSNNVKKSISVANIPNNIGKCLMDMQQYDDALIHLKQSLEIYKNVSLDLRKDGHVAGTLNSIGSCLLNMQQYDDALIHLKQSLEIYKNVSLNLRKDGHVAGTLNNIGSCLMNMQQYDDALIHLKQSLEIYKNVSLNLRKDGHVAGTLNNIGSCLMNMQQYDDALIHLKQSLEIYKNVSLNLRKDGHVAGTLNSIGSCLMNMQQYLDALIHLKQSLEIYKNVSLNLRKDGHVAGTLNNIGSCLMNMQQYDDALIHLKQSLKIYKNVSLNLRKDGHVAGTLNNIGSCLMNMQQYDDALIHLKQSLEIYKNVSLDLRKDGHVAGTLNSIGSCLMNMQPYDDALIHLKQSLEIYKNVSLNLRKDGHVAGTLNNIGSCLMKMQQHDDALIHLKQSLEIYKNVSLNLRKDGHVAGTLNNIGSCLMNMQQYDDALIHLKQSLEIYKNVSLDLRKDGHVAGTLNNIGSCLMNMQQYDDALIHLKQSLEIYKNVSLNLRKDGNVAGTLNNIGLCLMEMKQHDDALSLLQQSLEIEKNISHNLRKNYYVAVTLNNIGLCLMKNQQYNNALIYLKRSLDIQKNISLNLREDGNLAFTIYNLGSCLIEMQQYHDALIHLHQSLEIFKNVLLELKKDGHVAMTLNNIGLCLMKNQQYNSALIHLKQSLEIYKNVSSNLRKDSNVASALNNTGLCLMEMQQYDNALIHLKQSLEIYKSVSLSQRKDSIVASTLKNIGSCLVKMQQYSNALIHLKQSLDIYKSVSLNLIKDGDVASALSYIGLCFMEMQQKDNAFIHLKKLLEIKKNMEKKASDDEELQLAEQMKQSYCKEPVGNQLKETDSENAAEILHNIALIYKLRSPDKVSLIRCVGLLNAAILRNPSNISQMKADLNDVCKHVLEHAKANNRNADLVAKANTVKDEFQKLRKHVDNYLKQINAQIKTEELGKLQVRKAESIRFINKTIANKYKQIMADISKFCSDIMGKPPCEYSIVGMGSLARNEITPYSDFEHIILLRDDENYEQHLEYFRWYSVIFHIIVLNLQESIIPSLNIKSLSWFFDAHTPQGISVDGMMPHACKFPLGRFEKTKNKPFVTELIKPVSEMLKYLSSEEDLKNGYHLADILTKTCFVFGNENIFDQFANGVKTYLSSKSKRERINDMKKQVRDDLIKFFVRFRLANLKSQDTINIKQLVYRSSTLFVSALGSIHNISECSCFDIIQAMANKNIISQTTKVKLSYAVAIACEMRLRVYTERKSQCDNPIELNETDENIKKFLSIVGVKNTINYFQIAYCLQREVAKQLDFTKLHFYSDPRLINITIGIAFGIELLHSISEIPLKCDWRVRNFNFDDCIETLETKFHFNYDIMKNDFHEHKKLIVTLADHRFEVNIFDESLELYQQFLAVLHKDTTEKNTNRTTARIYQKIGHCLIRLQKWSDSVKFFYKAIEIFQLTCLDQETDEELAIAFNQLGFALKEVYQYTEASIYLKRSLKIEQKISGNIRKNDNDASLTLVAVWRKCIN